MPTASSSQLPAQAWPSRRLSRTSASASLRACAGMSSNRHQSTKGPEPERESSELVALSSTPVAYVSSLHFALGLEKESGYENLRRVFDTIIRNKKINHISGSVVLRLIPHSHIYSHPTISRNTKNQSHLGSALLRLMPHSHIYSHDSIACCYHQKRDSHRVITLLHVHCLFPSVWK